MRVRFALSAIVLIAVAAAPGGAAAQPPLPSDVPLGGVRVPACPVPLDPEYGLVREKPIEIGGGPFFMAARKARYVAALRGPAGEPVRPAGAIGSGFADLDGERVIVDSHTLVYDGPDGPVETTIYMNAYRFSLPRAPVGFTCGAPLPTAVGPPPLDPQVTDREMAALALEYGARGPIALPPLDPATDRGIIVDRFLLTALQARAGSPGDAPATQGITVLATPQACNGRTIAPLDLEMTGPQGPVPRRGDLLRSAAIEQVMPGVSVPADSIAAGFAPVQGAQLRVTYGEGCAGAPAAVTLPIRTQPARLLTSSPATLPAARPDIAPDDAVVYLQVIIHPDGRFVRPVSVGGPRVLESAAMDTIDQWRVDPFRINGTPTAMPMVLQVAFR